MDNDEFVPGGAVARLTAENSLAAATMFAQEEPGIGVDAARYLVIPAPAAPKLVGAVQSPIHPIAVS